MNSFYQTDRIVKKNKLKLSKSLGQNFLIDNGVLDQIVEASDLNKEDIVVEIGPGIGTLTKRLAERSGKVIAIEIDKRLIPVLSKTLVNYDNIVIINQDILKTDLKEILEDEKLASKNIKVVANLPYYITTPIIMKLLAEDIKISLMVLMMQEEVADRMNAVPSTKSYGSLSVAIQYFCDSQIVCKVARNSFYPSPDVNSAVIKLKPRQNKIVDIIDEDTFFKIVKGSFAKRRKTIINSLIGYSDLVEKEKLLKVLEMSNIDPKRRGETLDINEFANLANNYYTKYG